jgi:F-type H+-transporting ATPase subunit epsilon
VADTKFTAEVLTPEGEVFKDEVVQISTKTTVGSIGILANHEPVLAMLDPTELRLYRSNDDIVRLAAGEGYVQVSPDHVLILVEEALDPSTLNVSELQDRLRQADAELEHAQDESEEQRLLRRDKRRWEAFLAIAQGGADAAH